MVFNYLQFLLVELIDNAVQAWEDPNHKFHYSWLLILVSFTLWANSPDYEQMDVPLPCLGAKYQNLWEDKKNKILQKDNNIEFFLHTKELHNVIRRYH